MYPQVWVEFPLPEWYILHAWIMLPIRWFLLAGQTFNFPEIDLFLFFCFAVTWEFLILEWECGLSGGMIACHMQSPEFNPQKKKVLAHNYTGQHFSMHSPFGFLKGSGSFSMFISVYMSRYMRLGCPCMWRPTANARCLSQSLSALYLMKCLSLKEHPASVRLTAEKSPGIWSLQLLDA